MFLDWCSNDAAKYAVENWHYSQRMPQAKQKIGVWEHGRFIGAVLIGLSSARLVYRAFGLGKHEVNELVRVALTDHATPVSRILAIAIRLFKKKFPQVRVIVSYADTAQGHHGGIYKANGWVYLGSNRYHVYRVNGEIVHPRTLHDWYGFGGQAVGWLRANVDPGAKRIVTPPKHKYAKALDAEMAERLKAMAKPYPRATGVDSDTAACQVAEAGASPSVALSNPSPA